jgi:hypothetical protein
MGGRAPAPAGLDVVGLASEAVAAIHAPDPVEAGRLAELQGDGHLDRDVLGPALEVEEVDAVVEDAV